MRGVATDLRHAARSLRRSPGYALLFVGALALGIAANGAIFSFVEALMLRPLPYPQPERLAMPHLTAEGGRFADGPTPWSYPKLLTFAREQRAFGALAGFVGDSANLTGRGEPERVQLEMVSPAYHELLGVRPVHGRGFAAADAAPDAPLVALLGEGLWRRRFGADPAVLGRTLQLNKVPVTVVGVVPGPFAGLSGDAELWVPITAASRLWYPEALTNPGNHFLDAVGRLAPGVTPEALTAEMERVGAVVAKEHPGGDRGRWSAGALPLVEARRDANLRRALVVLLAAVGAVLLIACANLAGLAMVRAARRRRELAIRLAIGATGPRLLRQLLAESALLALAGCAAGLLLATWLVRALAAIRPETFGEWGLHTGELQDLAAAAVGAPVVAYCLVLAAVTAVACGLAPALRASRMRIGAGLREGGGSLGGWGGIGRSRGLGGGRGLLVAGQVAVATVLLVGAGLLVRSLGELHSVDLGYEPDGVLTFAVSPPEGDFPDSRASAALHAAILDRLAALPGVAHAAVGTCAPTSTGCNSTNVKRVDGEALTGGGPTFVGAHMVSPDYFRVLGVPVVSGRPFAARDRAGAPRVAVVNQSAARLLWPGRDALGGRLQIGMGDFEGEEQAEVVGIVGDVRYGRVEEEAEPAVYLPDAQAAWPMTTVLVRTEGDPLALVAAAREAVRAVDANLPIYRIRTLEEQVGFALSRARFASLLLGCFAVLAVGLAAVGVYGVLAQLVQARRRELGLRLALGATSQQLRAMVLSQGLGVALVGAVVGVALAVPAARALGSLLFAVRPHDPVTFLVVPLALVGAALVACLLPARRAARLEPHLVMRQD